MTQRTQRVLVGIRLPVALHRALKVRAAQNKLSVQEMVEQAVRQYLTKMRGRI
jgi:predicted HicB family RNase H-like nuclease